MITVSEHFWLRMLDEFSSVRHAIEQVCYFDGVMTDAGGGVVTTLTLPNALLHADHFHVEPEAMSQAGKHLRTLRLRRLAQIHTHPDAWTGHSSWDNQWAYSQLPGAISIVLPHRGRTQPRLADAGVHLRTETGWRQLEADEVPRYVRIVPAYFDFRPSSRSAHERSRVESSRRRSWWSFLAFWRW